MFHVLWYDSIEWRLKEADSRSATPCGLWGPKIYPIHRNSPLVPILREVNPFHALWPYFYKIILILLSYLCMHFSRRRSEDNTEIEVLLRWKYFDVKENEQLLKDSCTLSCGNVKNLPPPFPSFLAPSVSGSVKLVEYRLDYAALYFRTSQCLFVVVDKELNGLSNNG